MPEFPWQSRSRLLMLTVVAVLAIVVVLVVSFVLVGLFTGPPSAFQLNDPSNDVVVSAGTQYPGMIDVAGAGLTRTGTTLTVTVNVRDAVSSLSSGQYAQWNITLILENDTDVQKTFVATLNMNSTSFTGAIVDVADGTVQTCQVGYGFKNVTMTAVIGELTQTRVIEWNILSTYESYAGNELVTSASDLAPDAGLQSTVLGT